MRLQSSIASLSLVVACVLSAGSASGSEALVDAKWVQDNVTNPKVRIFEVSVDTGVYERGHIPGAVHLNWHTDLVDPQKRDIASRDASKRSCAMPVSTRTRPSFSMATTTTGLQHGAPGCSRSMVSARK